MPGASGGSARRTEESDEEFPSSHSNIGRSVSVGETARTAAVLAVLGAFFAGYLLGGQPRSKPSRQGAVAPDAVVFHSHAHHGTIDVSGDPAVPWVDLGVHQDAISGMNLEIITENFRFAPEHASTEHVAGEGHAHLYVDGTKIARLYSRWFHMAELAPGSHTIRVTLNANSHEEFTAAGEVIQDVERLAVTGR